MVHFPKTARSITAAVPLIFVLLLELPTLARADFFLHHWEDHYEPVHSASVEGDLPYYMTNQNYGPRDCSLRRPNSDSYSRQEVDGLVQLGLLDRLSFFGRLTWARVQYQQHDRHRNFLRPGGSISRARPFASLRRQNPSEAGFRSHWICKAKWIFPVTVVTGDDQTKTPYLGDQSLDITAGGFLSYSRSGKTAKERFHSKGGAGYTVRSSHFSAQMPWTLQRDRPSRKSADLTARFAAFGTTSMNQDNTLSDEQAERLRNRRGRQPDHGRASTPKRSFSMVKSAIRFPSNTRIYLAYEQSIWGEERPGRSNDLWRDSR